MTELLTAAQMRAIEAAAIAAGNVTGLKLMERAGQGVVDAIFAEWPELAPAASGGRGPAPSSLRSSPPEYFEKSEGLVRRAVVLCGPGNNGGDGFVVARLLRAAGWHVDVFFYGDVGKLPPDARVNYARWVAIGEVVSLGFPVADEAHLEMFEEAASHVRDLQADGARTALEPFVVIDALFGIGLNRAISGLDRLFLHWDYLSTFRDLNASRLVAIDVPSGLSGDTGLALDPDPGWSNPLPVLASDLTVTFHGKKNGHIGEFAERMCGKVVVLDIGL